jgi:hypothetical protein
MNIFFHVASTYPCLYTALYGSLCVALKRSYTLRWAPNSLPTMMRHMHPKHLGHEDFNKRNCFFLQGTSGPSSHSWHLEQIAEGRNQENQAEVVGNLANRRTSSADRLSQKNLQEKSRRQDPNPCAARFHRLFILCILPLQQI